MLDSAAALCRNDAGRFTAGYSIIDLTKQVDGKGGWLLYRGRVTPQGEQAGLNASEAIDGNHEAGPDAAHDAGESQHDTPAPASHAATGDVNSAMLAMLGALQATLAANTKDMAAKVREIVSAELAGRPQKAVKIALGDFPEVAIDTVHCNFETLLRAAAALKPSGHCNIIMTGPAGSGKSNAAKQLAKAFNVPFYSHGACLVPFEFAGFVDAAGHYHSTQFRQAFEFGGVCMLDELDSYSAQVTLVLQEALSNGTMPFPDGKRVDRHPDCIILAGANTVGTGATTSYIGRNMLDGAFLDRFVKLDWPVDWELVAKITTKTIADRVQAAADRAASEGKKVIIGPRAAMQIHALMSQGFSLSAAEGMTYVR